MAKIQTHEVVVRLTTTAAREAAVALLEKLVAVGQADAADTVDDGEVNQKEANLAAQMGVTVVPR